MHFFDPHVYMSLIKVIFQAATDAGNLRQPDPRSSPASAGHRARQGTTSSPTRIELFFDPPSDPPLPYVGFGLDMVDV